MSLESVVLKEVPSRAIAYLRCRGPWRQLPEMLAKLEEHLTRVGLKALGPASGVYHNTPNGVDVQELVWEVFRPVGFETAEVAEDMSGFGVRRLPSVRVATIIHRGSYRRTRSTYERLEGWIGQHELKVCGPAEEVYLSPISSPQGEHQKEQIEIRLPVCPI